ncbi:hypothetical protein KW792_00145 [Candidatus Saccharibacteria bacterium]|nr:hypothetical protein [Candidatus Saccharibacteria bacterium]
MKLYTLIRTKQEAEKRGTYQLLQQACDKLSVELSPIELNRIFLTADSSEELIEKGQGWFRLIAGPRAALAESILIRDDLSTIYDEWRIKIQPGLWSDTILMQKAGLPIIPTVFAFAGPTDEGLQSAVDSLGGFPVVLKCSGLSHGQGVTLCNSMEELMRKTQAYEPKDYAKLAMRKFIPGARHIRAVVIGDKCVDAIEYDKQPDDFRTNAVAHPTAKPYEAPTEITKLAVSAARANGVKFAGIDILLGSDGAYIAELNNPCNFARNYLTNGKNLALDLVEYLTISH